MAKVENSTMLIGEQIVDSDNIRPSMPFIQNWETYIGDFDYSTKTAQPVTNSLTAVLFSLL
jgi:hypothetical protein